MSVASQANYFIERYGYESYLEVGMHRGKTFKCVECKNKTSVEPAGKKRGGIHPTHAMTSDEFFLQNKDTFDIVFIDGLHHADQFMRDVINSLKYLNEGGIIFCHDINPVRERFQLVPRHPEARAWRGDVWKSWVRLRATRADLRMHTIQSLEDKGGNALGAIQRGEQELLLLNRNLIDPSYEDLEANRKKWLNLITWEEFIKI
tara:strand:+ start:1758 stop:2369 length:612 start_codon:yes stop_codon:yes gene_type:complete